MNNEQSGGYLDPRLAAVYDHVPEYASRADVKLFVDAAVASGGPVLELGCGTGRVLLPTARAGIEITGLDLAEPMLDILRGKLAAEPEEVRRRVSLLRGDMRSFDLGRRFALVTIPFRPFQHLLTVEDQMSCLGCIERHLENGGRLILDVFNPSLEALVRKTPTAVNESRAVAKLPDGRTIKGFDRVMTIHRAEQYLDVEIAYELASPDGSVERVVQAFPMRYLFRYEVEHLLARCGLRVVALYGSYDRAAFTDGSPEMIFVAEKLPG
jgi:SAM-dependent methyltransferase